MHKDFHFHSRWLAFLFFVLAGLGFLGGGCGKKGPPRPPRQPSPPPVQDLSYAIDNRRVELSWTIEGADDRSASSPVGYKVFRSKLSAQESNCEKCPLHFVEIGNLMVESKRAEKSKPIKMRFTELVEPGYRYIYKVIAYDNNGQGSKDSNVVQFDH